jgi:GNAT superfamily N-acetyltransferase
MTERTMSAEFIVRVATPSDEASIGDLLGASYRVLMAASYDPAALAAALPSMTRAQPALLSSGTYYLAESPDRRVVGCGGWIFERPGSGETAPGLAHIRHFATHPDWARRGVGRTLYDTCEQAARRAGARRFECYASLNAEGFYGALGFSVLRRTELPVGPAQQFPALLMERSI